MIVVPVQSSTNVIRRVPSSPDDTRYPVPAVAAGLAAGAAVGAMTLALAPVGVAVAVGLVVTAFLGSSVKFADQWEKAVVLRLGRYRGLRGPGLFFVIPIIDRVTYHIDQRIRTTDFGAESCLTRDTVPVNVDAICFWMVWDAKKAILEVENFYKAIVLSAQTALRDIIGTHQLSELLTHREKLGKRLQEILDEKTNPWGITVQAIEIRDIAIPKALEG